MRNLARLSNAANRIESAKDFNALSRFAVDAGHREIVQKHFPPQDAGRRTIDKHAAKIRAELKAIGIEPPSNLSTKEAE